eukprot:365040-Chlamydomonas_euryale.AAC.14
MPCSAQLQGVRVARSCTRRAVQRPAAPRRGAASACLSPPTDQQRSRWAHMQLAESRFFAGEEFGRHPIAAARTSARGEANHPNPRKALLEMHRASYTTSRGGRGEKGTSEREALPAPSPVELGEGLGRVGSRP